jgi:hypothetical protein
MLYEQYLVRCDNATNFLEFSLSIMELRIKWKANPASFKNEYGITVLEYLRHNDKNKLMLDTFCNLPWKIERLSADDVAGIRDLLSKQFDVQMCVKLISQYSAKNAMNVLLKAGVDISPVIKNYQNILVSHSPFLSNLRETARQILEFIERL